MGRFFRILVRVVRHRARDQVRNRRTGDTGQSDETRATIRDPDRAAQSRSGRTQSSSDHTDMRREAAAIRRPGTGGSCRPSPCSTFGNLEACRHPITELVVAALVRVWSCSDHEVSVRGDRKPAEADDLPQPSPETISLHRSSSMTRHYDSHPRPRLLSGLQEDIERPTPLPTTSSEHIPDVARSPESAGTGERTSVRHGPGRPPAAQRRCLRWTSSLTVREWRPRRRRRARTFRPALVFMRERNPWSFRRFFLLGFLYVGCISSASPFVPSFKNSP